MPPASGLERGLDTAVPVLAVGRGRGRRASVTADKRRHRDAGAAVRDEALLPPPRPLTDTAVRRRRAAVSPAATTLPWPCRLASVGGIGARCRC